MGKEQQVKKPYWHTILYFVIGVGILAYLLPRQGRFPYEIQKGQVWAHDDYYAPFDVPIQKTQHDLFVEYDSILHNFSPYLQHRGEIGAEQHKLLEKVLLSKTELDSLQKGVLLQRLDSIYSIGIYSDRSTDKTLSIADIKQVNVVKNHMAVLYNTDELLTPIEAYSFMLAATTDWDSTLRADIGHLNLNEYLVPNLQYDIDLSKKAQEARRQRMTYTKGIIPMNKLIISHGETINEENYNLLMSVKQEYETRIGASDSWQIVLGKVCIVMIAYALLYVYMAFFRPSIFYDPRRMLFLMLLSVFAVAIICLTVQFDWFSLYLLPTVMLPVVVCTFYDARTATFIYLVSLLMGAMVAPNGFEFFLLNFVAGVIGIVNVHAFYHRRSLLKSIFFVILSYCVVYSALLFMHGVQLHTIDWWSYLFFVISGLLIFLVYPSIFIFEKLFGFTSDLTLMELSDNNHVLLRKLSEVAPGTFQHSLQVANLGEKVIQKIGGNPLLMRVGALYHDIGKMTHPEWFTENQSGFNPHSEIAPEKSAEIIIQHVQDGVDLANTYGLPSVLQDFITTHHGTSITRYFHYQYKQQHPEMTPEEDNLFRYPGPEPTKKELVVMMMCDSIEAASRSLKEYTTESISNLVESIVKTQIEAGQYNLAEISYKEVNQAKAVIKQSLQNIYHVRVAYPKDEK